MNEQESLRDGAAGRPKGRIAPATMRAVSVTAVAALLVGLIAGPIVSGRSAMALDSTGTQEHTITVGGSAVVSVTPDVADVVIGVSAEQTTARAARDEAAKAMTGVIAAIKKDGVADKDIATINVALEPVYDYSSQKARLTGYRFSNQVRLTVRNLNALPAVIDDSVAAGATTVQGISFRVGDPKGAQAQAREAAMADARSKADALARAGGVTIKGVASISETAYTPPTPVYYDSAKYAQAAAVATPIQTGTTDVQVQVTVSFLI